MFTRRGRHQGHFHQCHQLHLARNTLFLLLLLLLSAGMTTLTLNFLFLIKIERLLARVLCKEVRLVTDPLSVGLLI